MKRIGIGLVLFALAVNVAVAGDSAVTDVERSKVCMLQDQVQTRAGIEYAYEGKTYYLCCPMCVTTFQRDPGRYAKALDPVSGHAVDKATAPLLGYGDRAYFFESDESRAAFAKDPRRYLHADDAPGKSGGAPSAPK